MHFRTLADGTRGAKISSQSVIFEYFSPTFKSQICRTLRVPERLPPAEVLVATSGVNTRRIFFYHSLFNKTSQAELTYRLPKRMLLLLTGFLVAL